jgi:hypothetical protein
MQYTKELIEADLEKVEKDIATHQDLLTKALAKKESHLSTLQLINQQETI